MHSSASQSRRFRQRRRGQIYLLVRAYIPLASRTCVDSETRRRCIRASHYSHHISKDHKKVRFDSPSKSSLYKQESAWAPVRENRCMRLYKSDNGACSPTTFQRNHPSRRTENPLLDRKCYHVYRAGRETQAMMKQLECQSEESQNLQAFEFRQVLRKGFDVDSAAR